MHDERQDAGPDGKDRSVPVTRTAAMVHKWLALIVAVPILFWFGSGLFFALAPIERVRSEHRIAKVAEPPIAFETAAAGLARLAADRVAAGERIELRSLLVGRLPW